MDDLKVALVNLNSVCGETRKNYDKHIRWIEKAKDKGVDIVCFPELSLTGYSSREEFRVFSESVDGKIVQNLKVISKKENLTIMAGISEKGENGERYASHLTINPDETVSVYRKVHLAPPEKKFYKEGNNLSLSVTKEVICGVQLCYDIHFPELTTAMTVEGAEVIFIPHASPRGTPEIKFESWMRHLRARAFDNSVFILACNQTGANGYGLNFSGVSVAIDPSGEIIDKRLDSEEGMLVVKLKKDVFDHVRGHEMRHFFPNRRPDVYKL